MKNMKKLIALAVLTVATAFCFNAQANDATNLVTTVSVTKDAPTKDYGHYELTLAGGGIATSRGNTQASVDVSLATDPFAKLPSLWVGAEQSVGWQSSFAGSTDLFADWSFNVYKQKVFINPGWNVGTVYGNNLSPSYRTGPFVEAEYYITDNVFVIADVYYDISKNTHSGDTGNGNDTRLTFGIGYAW